METLTGIIDLPLAFSYGDRNVLSTSSPIVCYGLLLTLTIFCAVRYMNSPWRSLPPGPRGLPLIGNLLQLRAPTLWLKFTEWKTQYGDIIYLNVGGQPMVVLGSQKVAADLLDRRANIYSDRPKNIVAGDLLTGGLFIAFAGYTAIWRRLRRAAHEGLYKGAARKYYPNHMKEATILTSQVMGNPDEWRKHFQRASGSNIMSVLYDKKPIIRDNDPQVVEIIECASRITNAALPGSYLVEFFPWMMYIPARIAKWRRDAEALFEPHSQMFEGHFNEVHKRMENGEDRPSLAAQLIKEKDRNDLTLRENAWLAGAMFVAGTETTTSVLSWWLLAMMLYPDVQKRAQEELDRVVGRSRMPTFADMEHLPYIASMVKEALRWRPADPLGLPHRSIQDDWYNGYFIPKGTIVVPNVWGLNRDQEVYGANADEFDPARYLDANGKLASAVPDTKEEGHHTYGFGYRICMGRHLANNALFINMAMLSWAFNIERAKDADGNLIPVDVDGCEDRGVIVAPVHFTPKISPRFPEAVDIVEQEREMLGLL